MWKRCNPAPTSGSITFTRPKKYIEYYSISYAYLQQVVDRAKKRFTPEDLQKLEQMLRIVSDELMPEIPLPGSQAETPRPGT